jgi:hypothetical protein
MPPARNTRGCSHQLRASLESCRWGSWSVRRLVLQALRERAHDGADGSLQWASYSARSLTRCLRPVTSVISNSSLLTVRTNRSAKGLALGARIGLRITSGILGCEHFVERACELGVAVTDQEPEVIQSAFHREVARLLGEHRPSGFLVTPTIRTPGPDLNQERHVECAQEHGLHGEEVTGQDSLSLGPQERRPARPLAPGSRPDPGAAKDRADCGRATRCPAPGARPCSGSRPTSVPPWPSARSDEPARNRAGARPALRCRNMHLRLTSSRCQRRIVAGDTINPLQRSRSIRSANAAITIRSRRRRRGRGV